MPDKDLLLIMVQPREVIRDWGLETEDPHWFSNALGCDLDDFTVVHAIEEQLPETIKTDGVIIGGSAHSVNEDKEWIEDLQNFVLKLYKKNTPTLGVCFGHQIIIETLGGEVESGKHGYEMGLVEIELNKSGQQDKLFENVENCFNIASSHQDTVTLLPRDLDKKVEELGHSKMYNRQAVAIGENIRTIQFHPEMTSSIIDSIITSRSEKLIGKGVFDSENSMEEHVEKIHNSGINETGEIILKNFYQHFV